ncbi:LysE family translocator [Rhodobacteraceae bacterium NNCM2]|nr:LysE family translocator [Coraliihabitans acroporae]
MTVTFSELALFAAAMFVLVASPGPFVAALAARSAALGPRSGVAMALGASVTEAIWIGAALLGLGAIAAAHGWALEVLKYVGAAWLIWIGVNLMTARHSLVKPGGVAMMREPLWRAFSTGALLNLGNPKAALFYMAVFPGFFDMTALTMVDGLVILAVAAPIGLGSDLSYVWAAAGARRLLNNSRSARRVDQASGGVLTGAGVAIAAT